MPYCLLLWSGYLIPSDFTDILAVHRPEGEETVDPEHLAQNMVHFVSLIALSFLFYFLFFKENRVATGGDFSKISAD